METTQADIGVIVGRFQVPELHNGHLDLINGVMAQHKRVVILLGVSAALVTRNNPLDFVTRKEMLLHHFPNISVLSIPDMSSDKNWSAELDRRVREACPIGSVLLYGSRDSFIPSYSGHFSVKEIGPSMSISGTELRREVSREIKASADFRSGVIFAAYNQYPKVYATVDVAIVNENRVLLGRKPNQEKFRFIGGFSDPTDDCYETAARREAMEETGLTVEDVRYIGSAKIDDWRYRSEEDKIISLFFLGYGAFGTAEAKDDIAELRWFERDQLSQEIFVNEHHVLYALLKKHWK